MLRRASLADLRLKWKYHMRGSMLCSNWPKLWARFNWPRLGQTRDGVSIKKHWMSTIMFEFGYNKCARAPFFIRIQSARIVRLDVEVILRLNGRMWAPSSWYTRITIKRWMYHTSHTLYVRGHHTKADKLQSTSSSEKWYPPQYGDRVRHSGVRVLRLSIRCEMGDEYTQVI